VDSAETLSALAVAECTQQTASYEKQQRFGVVGFHTGEIWREAYGYPMNTCRNGLSVTFLVVLLKIKIRNYTQMIKGTIKILGGSIPLTPTHSPPPPVNSCPGVPSTQIV